ncbi:MAG: hypothetical protein HYU52_11495 [Acidobacteria bacterium]|nr:hypothetical protein [Acidobacteriota bacterium]
MPASFIEWLSSLPEWIATSVVELGAMLSSFLGAFGVLLIIRIGRALVSSSSWSSERRAIRSELQELLSPANRRLLLGSFLAFGALVLATAPGAGLEEPERSAYQVGVIATLCVVGWLLVRKSPEKRDAA